MPVPKLYDPRSDRTDDRDHDRGAVPVARDAGWPLRLSKYVACNSAGDWPGTTCLSIRSAPRARRRPAGRPWGATAGATGKSATNVFSIPGAIETYGPHPVAQ